MDKFDERQREVRGSIGFRAIVIVIVLMIAAALINDFEIYDIEHNIGFSSFMIGACTLLVGYLSVSLILKDAYFGVLYRLRCNAIIYIFTALTLIEVALLGFDMYRGESVSFVTGCSICMVLSVTLSLWHMKKEWN